ncbi:MAG: hypothetical protein RLZZ623_994 [Actinomycetota bacterium]
MSNRDELEALLDQAASAPVPAPDPAFVEALEQRILTARVIVPPTPIRRHVTRATAVGITIAGLTFVGAAAAAGIVITANPERPKVAETVPTSTLAPTIAPSTTTGIESTSSAPAIVTSTVSPAPTTAPVSTVPPPVTSVAVSTSLVGDAAPPPVTTIVPTVPATPTSTTEVHVAATLTLSCGLNGTAVTCTWDAGPDGTVDYMVLRSIPGSTGPGRAYFPGPQQTYTDATVAAGTTYVYLVHARDAAGKSLGHSDAATVGCCG